PERRDGEARRRGAAEYHWRNARPTRPLQRARAAEPLDGGVRRALLSALFAAGDCEVRWTGFVGLVPNRIGGTGTVKLPEGVTSRYVMVGPIRTHYLEAGTGEPLILLHSAEFGGRAEFSWRYNIATLAERFHV